jgi:hypothetical protein
LTLELLFLGLPAFALFGSKMMGIARKRLTTIGIMTLLLRGEGGNAMQCGTRARAAVGGGVLSLFPRRLSPLYDFE